MDISKIYNELNKKIIAKDVIDLTRALIRIPSHEYVDGREKEVGLFVYDYLKANDIETELIPIIGKRANVYGYIRGNGQGKNLLLNGHLDTVPPFEMNFDPYEGIIENGYILGRGAGDMKGPIAAMLYAMKIINDSGIKLKGDVMFTGVIGEERRSEGTEYLVRSGIKADGAIVGEPSSYEYAIGHRGLESLELVIRGKSAHGGMPHLGINAIEKAAVLIYAIKEQLIPKLNERYSYKMGQSTLNLAVINGGKQTCIVPDEVRIKLDRRYISGESVDSVIAEFNEIINNIKEKDPEFDAEVIRLTDYLEHPPLDTDENAVIVQSVKEAVNYITGKEAGLTNKRGWTDAGLISKMAGIPTIIYGPGNIAFSHTKHEKILIDDLITGVKTYLYSILKFCEIEFDHFSI